VVILKVITLLSVLTVVGIFAKVAVYFLQIKKVVHCCNFVIAVVEIC